ncbi:unnamed protein product [Prunus armeniaca]
MGDFNEIISNVEKVGGNPRPQWQMDDFKEAISDCCFKEIPFLGSPFTWSRGSSGSLVKEHLDRGLASHSVFQHFEHLLVHHYVTDASDHAPLVLHAEILAPTTTFGKRRFHFEAMWANEEGCRNTLLEAWGEASSQSLPLTNKFLLCAQRLNSWGQQQFGSLPKQIQQCYLELQNLDLDAPNFDPTKKHKLSVKLDDLFEKEDTFWKQRSQVQWLREGDRNTHYFHEKLAKEEGNLFGVFDDNNCWFDEEPGIQRAFIDYFQKLFTYDGVVDVANIMHAVETKVTPEMNAQLTHPFDLSEISHSLSQIGPLKAPGSDGLPALFFQKYWDIIG